MSEFQAGGLIVIAFVVVIGYLVYRSNKKKNASTGSGGGRGNGNVKNQEK